MKMHAVFAPSASAAKLGTLEPRQDEQILNNVKRAKSMTANDKVSERI
jgi:hypothetical protein